MGHVMYLDNRAVLSIQVRGHLYVVLNCLNYKSRDFLGVFLDTSLSGTKLSQSQVQAGTVLTFIKQPVMSWRIALDTAHASRERA